MAEAAAICARLVGAWELQTYTATSISQPSDVVYPLTERPLGLLMYSADGFMSAHLQLPDQHRSGNKTATETENPAGHNYSGYTGRFWVETQGDHGLVLLHLVRVCSRQDWLNQPQYRRFRFEVSDGHEEIILGPTEPHELQGTLRRVELRWRRVTPDVWK